MSIQVKIHESMNAIEECSATLSRQNMQINGAVI